LGVIIFSTNPMRKVWIIYWEDSQSGPYIPEPQTILESSDGLGTPWNRMFGSAATRPVSQFSRTAHQDRIHQLDRARVVAMTGNENILLSFALA
jgi:hypothetical protein